MPDVEKTNRKINKAWRICSKEIFIVNNTTKIIKGERLETTEQRGNTTILTT